MTHTTSPASPELEPVFSGDEADLDGEGRHGRRRSRMHAIRARDFESEAQPDDASEKSRKDRKKSKKSKKSRHSKKDKEKKKRHGTDAEKTTSGRGRSQEASHC